MGYDIIVHKHFELNILALEPKFRLHFVGHITLVAHLFALLVLLLGLFSTLMCISYFVLTFQGFVYGKYPQSMVNYSNEYVDPYNKVETRFSSHLHYGSNIRYSFYNNLEYSIRKVINFKLQRLSLRIWNS